MSEQTKQSVAWVLKLTDHRELEVVEVMFHAHPFLFEQGGIPFLQHSDYYNEKNTKQSSGYIHLETGGRYKLET